MTIFLTRGALQHFTVTNLARDYKNKSKSTNESYVRCTPDKASNTAPDIAPGLYDHLVQCHQIDEYGTHLRKLSEGSTRSNGLVSR